MALRRSRRCGCEGWAHSETYRGLHPASFLHRARLRTILSAIGALETGSTGRLADFGCSDGFILEHIKRELLLEPGWTVHGFDKKTDLLEAASHRQIPGAAFEALDFGKKIGTPKWDAQFDIVTCFETFEHMGDYRAGLENVCRTAKPGGFLVFTIPYESGIPGLTKFFARKLLDRDPYRGFFKNSAHERKYVRTLLKGGDLAGFRDPAVAGWGVHLGFDANAFEAHLLDAFVRSGEFRLVEKRRTGFGFGRLVVLRRCGAAN